MLRAPPESVPRPLSLVWGCFSHPARESEATLGLRTTGLVLISDPEPLKLPVPLQRNMHPVWKSRHCTRSTQLHWKKQAHVPGVGRGQVGSLQIPCVGAGQKAPRSREALEESPLLGDKLRISVTKIASDITRKITAFQRQDTSSRHVTRSVHCVLLSRKGMKT